MTLGWGVVSTGRAADVLVGPAIEAAEGSKITAVYSRDKARADESAAKHDVASAYTSYEEMLADPAVEVVYIASPNALHYEQVVAAAKAGRRRCKPLRAGALLVLPVASSRTPSGLSRRGARGNRRRGRQPCCA